MRRCRASFTLASMSRLVFEFDDDVPGDISLILFMPLGAIPVPMPGDHERHWRTAAMVTDVDRATNPQLHTMRAAGLEVSHLLLDTFQPLLKHPYRGYRKLFFMPLQAPLDACLSEVL